MAEKPEGNRSQAIRDYFQANPQATSQEVVDALAKQGITITVGYVRQIKMNQKARQQAERQVVAGGVVGIREIKAAFAFIKAVGSAAVAKQALAAAVEIKKIA